MRILIADDNDSDRLILKTILEKQGYAVSAAENGAQALDLYKKFPPDLVLLDALMPVMDGFEVAKAIKSLAGEHLIPIIFITSLKGATSLADCLEAGGDDFISKPYNRVILHAKIQAHVRMKRLHTLVQEQRDKIAQHREHLIREQEVAKAIFDNIAHNGCITSHNIKYLLSPMAVFNGDMVLVARKPSSGMYVLLGDFTGHGLPAAIGALPASEIFYGMTRKGFTMQEILRELNLKLKQILPTGVFCCACMVDLSFHDGIVKIWMGALPDIIIYRSKTHESEFVKSKNLPLGVLSDDRLNTSVEVFKLDYGDKIYLWSDGIHEAKNSTGEMFGSKELINVFQRNQDPGKLFEEILSKVRAFTGGNDQDDDHTLVEVTMVKPSEMSGQQQDQDQDQKEIKAKENYTTVDCTITCELRPDSLKSFNPLPFLTHFIREVPGLKSHSGKLYTILAELYSNSLEHGLLGLSSELKQSPNGFSSYYMSRTKALESLKEGKVIITLTSLPKDYGGELIIRVEDTGEGFDYNKFVKGEKKPGEGYSGRGIPLIFSMCKSVEYIGKGNIVEVSFEWSYD